MKYQLLGEDRKHFPWTGNFRFYKLYPFTKRMINLDYSHFMNSSG